MFGRRKENRGRIDGRRDEQDGGFFGDETPEVHESSEADSGPFDLTELDDDREALAESRLDLGSVLVPLPAGGQLQVEMTPAGAPQAVHVVTQYGRITIAAYAAPKSPGQWREVAADLASSLRNDSSEVSVEDGPWGRELHGVTANADLRFIGIDGYRWMVRCVLAGPAGAVNNDAPLVQIAREVLSQTVVDRGTDPHPVRTPLPVVLPAVLVEQLAAAQEQQAAQQQQQQAEQVAYQAQQQPESTQQAGITPAPTQSGPNETPRRGSSGSAMQQLGG